MVTWVKKLHTSKKTLIGVRDSSTACDPYGCSSLLCSAALWVFHSCTSIVFLEGLFITTPVVFHYTIFQRKTHLHIWSTSFSSWQISSPLQCEQPRQSKATVICQEEGLLCGGGGLKAAPLNIRCRPCPWLRHGQQRKWADMLWWCAGELQAPCELCRGL